MVRPKRCGLKLNPFVSRKDIEQWNEGSKQGTDEF